MTTTSPATPTRGGEAALGLVCTGILALTYLTFTGLAAFAPALLAAPLKVGPGLGLTWAFAAGLGVIGLGFVLTVAYALIANRRERAAEQLGLAIGAEGAAR